MGDKTIAQWVSNLFLSLAVVTALAISTIGFISGSAPEWVTLKASIALATLGLLGWALRELVCAVTLSATAEAKGNNVDVTLSDASPDAHPASASVDQSANGGLAERQ